jgi:hypothetical protein
MRKQVMRILTSDTGSEVRRDRDVDGRDAVNSCSGLLQGTGESDFNNLELGVGHSDTSGPRHESDID